MYKRTLARPFAVALLLLSLVLPGAPTLAGTTGTLTGTAVDASTSAPLAGAKVTAASPSAVVTQTTDASGRYTFLGLSPDTYTLSVEFSGYDQYSQTGVTVTADSTRQLQLSVPKTLRTIGKVGVRGSASLVRPGTTADVYTVGAVQQQAVQGVGGGGSLNSAYSAIATVPGAYVPTGQSGYFQNTYIRGGDYDQVGYEVDGVPVNRAFDNYPSGSASSLGQQEVQVYTGAAPAGAEAQGLAGFINQVIKTGTYPGSEEAELGIAGPSFYHKVGFELGGATSNRNFSYYLGSDGYNQEFRYGDQFNGAGITQLYGVPLGNCGATTIAQTPTCFSPSGANYATNTANVPTFALGPYNAFSTSQVKIRNDVANFHIGIPHKDGTKDDIQLLGYENTISTQYYDSLNDLGGAATYGLLAGTTYPTEYQYSGKVGVPLPANYASLTSPYLYPQLQSSVSAQGSAVPADLRDAISNEQSIFKLQYTKTLGSSALFRLYGYTFYSSWLQVGPGGANANFYGPVSPDYELTTHSRGISGTLSDQVGAHLLQLQGSFTTASSLRDNNQQPYNSPTGAGAVLGLLVDSSNPTNGLCYNAANTAAPVFCGTLVSKKLPNAASYINDATAYAIRTGAAPNVVAPAATCGGGPCEYFTVGNGQRATYNTVKPNFAAAALTDSWRPTSKLTIDLGIRLDDYQYVGTDTTGTPARALYFNSYNKNYCSNTLGQAVTRASVGGAFNTDCPTGYKNLNLQNTGAITQTYPEFQPRAGLTFALDPRTVVRASYGRYTQAPNAAFEQYNYLQQNSPTSLLGFYPLGFTSPDHRVVPQTSNNFDVSLERSFGDTSVKISPFLRNTQNQIQQFYLDQKTNFVSGLNVGRQRSQGVEFELDKGNFANQGLSAKLSFTYTNSYVHYNTLAERYDDSRCVQTGHTSLQCLYVGVRARCKPNVGSEISAAARPRALWLRRATRRKVTATDGTAPQAAARPSLPPARRPTWRNPYYNAPLQPFLSPATERMRRSTSFPGGIGTCGILVMVRRTSRRSILQEKGRAACQSFRTCSSPAVRTLRFPRSRVTASRRINAVHGNARVDGRAIRVTPMARPGAARSMPILAVRLTLRGRCFPIPATGKFDNIGQFCSRHRPLQFGNSVQLRSQ